MPSPPPAAPEDVPAPDPPPVEASARAWSELLHAEVAYILSGADIPTLHIKGPTVAQWLYEEDERPWGDVDVLVPPDRLADALTALMDAGFSERFVGVRAGTTEDHAVTLVRAAEGPGSAEIDVHSRFDGIGVDPEVAFREMWRRREPSRLAHIDVWFPDLPTRALLIVLNTARTPNARTRKDLERLIAAADAEDWRSVIWLGRRLDCLPGLRTGLELLPFGKEIVRSTELADVEITTEWRLRSARAPRTALRLVQLRRMPWRARPVAIARWLMPAPGVIRMRDPRARGGASPLLLGYLRRLVHGLKGVGPTLRALKSGRRSPTD